jgi:hypothetical protein
MNIGDFSFHDSRILGVKENTQDDTLDFLINFPTDWQNNVFEIKTLRFFNVLGYSVNEIPFEGQPTIMEIVNLGQIDKTFGTGRNQINTVRT